MSSLLALVDRARSGPLSALPGRVGRFLKRRTANWVLKKRDRRRSTVLGDEEFARVLGLRSGKDAAAVLDRWVPVVDSSTLREAMRGEAMTPDQGLREAASEGLRHRFDLLGSGPVEVTYDTEAQGAFDHVYRMAPGVEEEERQLARMSALLDQAASFTGDTSDALHDLSAALVADDGRYTPIDWHIDFKSGYRWHPRTWFMDVPYGHRSGVDIKVPWELSRSHHMVSMSLSGLMSNATRATGRELALQLLDWIAANPPRFGVNWRSAMDTAIRAANWIWALSLNGEPEFFPPALKWLLTKSLYQHAWHIEANLDDRGHYTSNHYLAEIVGLMHIAYAFPQFPQSARWLGFCMRELTSEMDATVFPDGVNYEGSTGYHRLVTEMFLHGTLLALRLSDQRRREIASQVAADSRTSGRSGGSEREGPDVARSEVFPAWYLARLFRMAGYVADTTKPNGLAPQFGDQDSGRFVKFSPVMSEAPTRRPDEEHRDHRHILAVSGVLFGDPGWSELGAGHRIESLALTHGIDGLPLTPPPDDGYGPRRLTVADHPNGVTTAAIWYPDGGTCILVRDEFWVAVKCGPTLPGPEGHRHNDQLSFELNVSGRDIVVDWGTGGYTPDFDTRNRLRSTASHSTLAPDGQEQNRLPAGRLGLFVLADRTRPRCLEAAADRFSGQHTGFGTPHVRTFRLEAGALTIEDSLAIQGPAVAVVTLAPNVRVRRKQDGRGLLLVSEDVAVRLEVYPPDSHAEVVSGSCSEAYGALRDSSRIVIHHHVASTRMTFSLASMPATPTPPAGRS